MLCLMQIVKINNVLKMYLDALDSYVNILNLVHWSKSSLGLSESLSG